MFPYSLEHKWVLNEDFISDISPQSVLWYPIIFLLFCWRLFLMSFFYTGCHLGREYCLLDHVHRSHSFQLVAEGH